MNKDTVFLLEKVDKNYKEVLDKIEQNHKEVLVKIESITTWKHKVAGASMAVTTFVSAAVSALVAFLSGR